MDENSKSKVYIQIDSSNRITRCEGGYTMGNIDHIEDWIYIDEGDGDKYNLCQSHYFDGGLFTEDGIHRWAYEDGETRRRTNAEIEADRKEREKPQPIYAPQSYEPGNIMTINGIMYRVLLPIFAGTQITVGTNVEETTIEAELARINKEV